MGNMQKALVAPLRKGEHCHCPAQTYRTQETVEVHCAGQGGAGGRSYKRTMQEHLSLKESTKTPA